MGVCCRNGRLGFDTKNMILAILVYLAIEIATIVSVFIVVPRWHRLTYHMARKDWYYWMAIILDRSLVGLALLQWWYAPSAVFWRYQVLGVVLMVVGVTFVLLAWRANPWFVPSLVAVPRELLVKEGIYRYFAHPGYAGMALSTIGKVLLFCQTWACLPATAYLVLLLWRTDEENQKVL